MIKRYAYLDFNAKKSEKIKKVVVFFIELTRFLI